MAIQQVKAEALAARIAGLSFENKGWAGKARAEARVRLSALGLPVKREEYWRYTDPTSLTSVEPVKAAPVAAEAAFAAIDQLQIVFTDGLFNAAASGDLASAGVSVERLAEVGASDSHWASGLYGVLEARGQTPVARPLAALNSAYATDGLVIRVSGAATRPIALVYENKSEASDVILHHIVKLEQGAALTVLESGTAGARFNTVMEVELADGARFNHVRSQGREETERRGVTHLFTRLGSEAQFKSFTVTANGRLTRNEAVIELIGDDAIAHVAGAAMGDGRDFLQDDTVFITHQGQRCESRQVYKKVLRNGATGVFQGKILVKQTAQKTDGYQISQSLLLDEDSNFLAKPELEIYADDVKCSHGSTSGAIDETALFYLQSRGVPRAQAQSLLVLAFLAEAIDEIEDEAIAEDVRARLEIWLHGR
ncbi:Fe-S cluster assembly protein SufD [Pseudogemmobacter faecipullorum]|uniref:Fe-S cluster assembly protein SufD n=1 Tax=Pseudogemmobacter faecipullorum TaxID=2755041 RepID=A0ABS8CJX3_9RHOB|nr:Fe-S cluster assembly protein SufD [Pseudogemmobacter faecipullorum]MCB5409675.1 Fe-S cluster assembly protein SufD [Pseudogemmobacter faecipullorum]